jgi:predicted LPLAT superfamily acyltransferase
MAGHMLERLNTTVNVIMLDAEHQKIKEYLSTFTRKSFHIIPIGDDNTHVYEISRALKDHEIVCMHGDRFMPGSKTISCRVLGEIALLPTGPFYLAMKYAVPVSFVFAMKQSNRHYHFYATPPKFYAQQASLSKRNDMLTQMVGDYAAAIEEKLKQYPYQWFNYYDFWNYKTPSSGPKTPSSGPKTLEG